MQKLALGIFFGVLILAGARLSERVLIKRTHVVYTRYNLSKMIRLMSWLLVLGVVFLREKRPSH